VNADTDAHRRIEMAFPVPALDELQQGTAAIERAVRIVVARTWHAKQDERPVARKLVDYAAMEGGCAQNTPTERGDEDCKLRGVHGFAERSRSADIHEEYRDPDTPSLA